MTALLRLSWPPQPLWPNRSNGRAWQAKTEAKTAYATEADCVALGHQGALRRIQNPALTVSFHKTNAGRFDLDNAYAAMKPAIDAICARWGRDDSTIHRVTLIRGEPVKGGCVMIEINEASE
jgi:hypothetical protein